MDHPEQNPEEKKVAVESTVETGVESQVSQSSSDNESWKERGLLGPEPTLTEMVTLRKVRGYVPLSAFFVAIVELAERFTYYGLTGPFQNYIQLKRNNGHQHGGLGMGQTAATGLNVYLQFFGYVTPIPGAMLADMWLGKYNTILVGALVYIIGTMIIFVTSLPQYLESSGIPGLIVGMTILAIGMGSIKANVSTLIADQYTNTHPYVETLKSGERVIVDPATTMQYIFELFYLCINIGSLSAIATTELEEHVDYWAAFLLPFAFFAVAIVALILGRNLYVRRPPQGSPIPNSFRIIGLMLKNGFLPEGKRYVAPEDAHADEYELAVARSGFMNKFDNMTDKNFSWIYKPFRRFTIDVARPSVRSELGLSSVPWDDSFVDQVRRALAACKVFVFYPIFWCIYGQMQSNFTSQAGQMETHDIPNDLMQNWDPIALIIFIPIMEWVGYPMLRKMGYSMLPMTRIFFGFIMGSCSMAWAAICQRLIYSAGPCYSFPVDTRCAAGPDLPNHVHVAVQTPAYVFMAMAEIFASITGLEYAYTKAPPTMKSFIMSLFLVTNAFGAALQEALVATAENPKLMWMYTGLSISCAVAGVLFWIVYHKLNDVEMKLNQLDQHLVENEEMQQLSAAKHGGKHGTSPDPEASPVKSPASGSHLAPEAGPADLAPAKSGLSVLSHASHLHVSPLNPENSLAPQSSAIGSIHNEAIAEASVLRGRV